MAESRPSLLLVDDDAVYRERLAKAITARGYEVRTADGAEAAVALAEAESPEFAVLVQSRAEAGLSAPVYGPWPASFRTVARENNDLMLENKVLLAMMVPRS